MCYVSQILLTFSLSSFLLFHATNFYPSYHRLLSGTDNIISFTTKRYFKQSLVVRGPGAGAEVTAGGVFGDLLRLAAYLGAPS